MQVSTFQLLTTIFNFTISFLTFRMSANVAASGSCAILSHIRSSHLHVANAGDCAAVLGINNHGNLVARQLSKPHTVDNADESARVRSQHPESERATILRGKVTN